jgi:SAM-dependent methyltransferase
MSKISSVAIQRVFERRREIQSQPCRICGAATVLMRIEVVAMLQLLKTSAKMALNSTLLALPLETRQRYKEYPELRYWRGVTASMAFDRAKREHERAHFEYFFTTFFGLTAADYAGRSVLDVGCGPCGSLEWARHARERVGLDPLADRYRKLVEDDKQEMSYCVARSEMIPFPDGHFDFVSAFNSLDHVDDVAATIRELKPVTAATGSILVVVEIGHAPTPTEPHLLDESLIDAFGPEFRPACVRLSGVGKGHNLWASLRNNVP